MNAVDSKVVLTERWEAANEIAIPVETAGVIPEYLEYPSSRSRYRSCALNASRFFFNLCVLHVLS